MTITLLFTYLIILIIQIIYITTIETKESQSNTEQIVSFEMKRFMNSLFLYISVGTPKKTMFEAINQNIQSSWSIPQFYKAYNSQSAKALDETTIPYKTNKLSAINIEDIINIPQTGKTATFLFKYALNNDEMDSKVGGFAFPFKFHDERYSIVHSFKRHEIINNLSYAMSPIDSHIYAGTFYFGGIPKSITNGMKSGSCKVDSTKEAWGCKLHQVIVKIKDKEYTYNNTLPSHFQVRNSDIEVPIDFYNYLKETALKSYISKEQCKYEKASILRYFTCHKDIVHQLPNITFVFERTALTISMKSLIEESFISSLLKIHNKRDQNEEWEFGFSFVSLFYSLYDYNNESVTFYGKQGIEIIERNINQDDIINYDTNINIKCLEFFTIGILIVGLLIIIFAKWKIKI